MAFKGLKGQKVPLNIVICDFGLHRKFDWLIIDVLMYQWITWAYAVFLMSHSVSVLTGYQFCIALYNWEFSN